MSAAPINAPETPPLPPRTTIKSKLIESCTLTASGTTMPRNAAYIEPPRPASAPA